MSANKKMFLNVMGRKGVVTDPHPWHGGDPWEGGGDKPTPPWPGEGWGVGACTGWLMVIFGRVCKCAYACFFLEIALGLFELWREGGGLLVEKGVVLLCPAGCTGGFVRLYDISARCQGLVCNKKVLMMCTTHGWCCCVLRGNG